jgi:hypothetical protein
VSNQKERLLQPVNGSVHHDMNTASVKDKDQLSSHRVFKSTQEDERYKQIQQELQDTKMELEDLKQQQHQKAEEIGGNGNNIVSSTREEDEYFSLDLNRFITVMNLSLWFLVHF